MSVKKAIKGGGSIIVHNSELYSELMGNCTEQQNEEEVVDQKQVRLLHIIKIIMTNVKCL